MAPSTEQTLTPLIITLTLLQIFQPPLQPYLLLLPHFSPSLHLLTATDSPIHYLSESRSTKFSNSWVEACTCIKPLHTGGGMSSLSNYCPVSLLPVLSKTLECDVCKQRVDNLTDCSQSRGLSVILRNLGSGVGTLPPLHATSYKWLVYSPRWWLPGWCSFLQYDQCIWNCWS